VAKTIATVTGIALAPGISRNRRLYSKPAIAKMVARAQERIKAGEAISLTERTDDAAPPQPLSQRTHHAAEDDSTKIVGRITSIRLDETGCARYSAAIAPTPAGQIIADLLDTTDGLPPFLRGVSIRAAWVGSTRMERGPDGDPVETGDDLELDGLDYTGRPGVPAAGVDTFAWAQDGARRETTERVLITESVQEARVTAITEETAPSAPEAGQMTAEARAVLRETLRGLPPEPPHVLRNGLCVTCETTEAALPLSKRGTGLSGGGKVYADPGYQADKKQRYDLSTRANAKSAWSYVSQKANAAKYTANQLKRVKGRIMKALKGFGVTVAAEGWVIEPGREITEAELREWYGDYGSPSMSGSWSLNASNGPVNLCLSCYGMDPADLDVILRAAADAACQALAALDPDMDGDIDVPGADSEDTDHDGGETADEADLAETADPDEAPAPQADAGQTEEAGTMPETTTAETAPAAALTRADINTAVAAALEADRTARKARKAARAAPPAEAAPAAAAPATETAPAAPAAAAESEADKISRLVREAIDREMPKETDDERITRLVQEGVSAARASLVQSGQVIPGRKGIVMTAEQAAAAAGGADVINESTKLPASWGDKPLHKMSTDEFNQRTGPVVVRHVLGDRADKIA
jgi:hypothetical protein